MFRVLASEYGYTPDEICNLTMPQVDMLAAKRGQRGGTIAFKSKAEAQAWQRANGFEVTA